MQGCLPCRKSKMAKDSAWGSLLSRYGRIFSEAWRVRHELQSLSRTREEAQFLPPVVEVLETPPPFLARMILWVVMLFFIIAVIWAIIGRTDIVATASGKIIPDDRIKIVQAIESGTIREIKVRDGDNVKRDDVLILLDTTITDAEYTQAKESWEKATADEMMAKLLASPSLDIASGSPPKLSDTPFIHTTINEGILHEYQQLLNGLFGEQKERLEQSYRDIEVQRKRLSTEERQAQKALVQAEKEDLIFEQRQKTENENLMRMERVLPIVMERFEASEMLWEKGVVPRNDVLSVKEEKISTEQQLKYYQSRLAEIEAEKKHRQSESSENSKLHKNRMAELRAEISRLEQSQILLVASFRRAMLDRQSEANGRSGSLQQELIKFSQSRKATKIVSPIDGEVQQLAVHTIGGVLQVAQALMVIVPENPKLEIEALLENKDIGFVREGQQAEIKIDAFPYTKYGLIEGEVSNISSDSIENEQQGLVYPTRVRMLQNTINVSGKEVPLAPGMRVVVEIKTGDRRVIEFFLSPFIRHWEESLDER